MLRRSWISSALPHAVPAEVLKKNGKGVEALKKPMTLCHLLMHTSGLGYGPGSITPGVPLVARSAEDLLLATKYFKVYIYIYMYIPLKGIYIPLKGIYIYIYPYKGYIYI